MNILLQLNYGCDEQSALLDILFNLVRMTPAIHKCLLYASIDEELQCVFDQGRIDER